MRALLDEQVPTELADLVVAAGPDHEGWKGLKNGELLRSMRDAGYGALVTIDRRMEYQQNIARSGVGLIVLHAFRTRLKELAPLAPAIALALANVQPGEIIHLHAPPSA